MRPPSLRIINMGLLPRGQHTKTVVQRSPRLNLILAVELHNVGRSHPGDTDFEDTKGLMESI